MANVAIYLFIDILPLKCVKVSTHLTLSDGSEYTNSCSFLRSPTATSHDPSQEEGLPEGVFLVNHTCARIEITWTDQQHQQPRPAC